MFSKEHWWGEAEPIAITAIKRKADTNIGYLRNISFENINCIGENGILIYGDDSHNIHNVHFSNVSLQLIKKTDWPKINHDLRPCMYAQDIIEGSLNAIYARNAVSVSMDNLVLTISDEMAEYIEKPFDVEDCDHFSINGKEL